MDSVLIDFHEKKIHLYNIIDDARVEYAVYDLDPDLCNHLHFKLYDVGRKTKKEKKQMCTGCEDNFYNDQNPYSIKECWHLENARVVKLKKVNINQAPPWKQEPVEVLNCRSEEGYVYVDPKRER